MSARVGVGYDVHKFTKGRRLFLGGVQIPYEFGLEGHSDADVVLHAVCDAILGAMGRGDIGEHFPNTDPKYKDISSLELLRIVMEHVRKEKFTVSNVDAVILAEEPNLKHFKMGMAENIARVLDIDLHSANIKATTSEGMGFIGRREGIACYATALLKRDGD
jgi:2-C-methyl-D-erythritol 2,4-cyclodiphosphate synthase